MIKVASGTGSAAHQKLPARAPAGTLLSARPSQAAGRTSGVMPAFRPGAAIAAKVEAREWEAARKRVQEDEDRQWAEALHVAKARAELQQQAEAEQREWAECVARTKARLAQHEEREWTKRISQARSSAPQRAPRPNGSLPRGTLVMWP